MKVLKKILVFVLVITMVCGMLSGCKSSKENDSKDKTDTIENSSDTEKEDKEETNASVDKKHPYQTFDELGLTVMNYGEVYYKIDSIDLGNSEVPGGCWVTSEDEWIGVYNNYQLEFSDDDFGIDISDIKSVDCLDIVKKQLENNLSSTLSYYYEEYEFETIDKELVTVNDWEMCKYTGKAFALKDGVRDAEFYLVTYIVLNEGYPMFFTIADISEGQGREQEIEDVADMTAKTYRVSNEEWD